MFCLTVHVSTCALDCGLDWKLEGLDDEEGLLSYERRSRGWTAGWIEFQKRLRRERDGPIAMEGANRLFADLSVDDLPSSGLQLADLAISLCF